MQHRLAVHQLTVHAMPCAVHAMHLTGCFCLVYLPRYLQYAYSSSEYYKKPASYVPQPNEYPAYYSVYDQYTKQVKDYIYGYYPAP